MTVPLNTLFLAIGIGTISLSALAQAAPAEEPTYAERLGWPKGARVVIFHVDDSGMCHQANLGAIQAMTEGVATSTSVMFPCPWVSEFAHMAQEHPDLDIGVHLTMTSEWKSYRWGPVAGKAAVPGLVDKEGCLWPDVPDVIFKAMPDEVEKEIRAQLDRCLAIGIKPTHLDSHMGTLFASLPFFDRYLKVGVEHDIPILVPGGHLEYIARETPMLAPLARQMGKRAWDAGLPIVDDIDTGGIDCKGPEDKKRQIVDFLRNLKPGITEFIVHCTKTDEHFNNISGSGRMRQAELDAMCDPEIRKVIEEEGIVRTTWRELKQRRDALKTQEQAAAPKP